MLVLLLCVPYQYKQWSSGPGQDHECADKSEADWSMQEQVTTTTHEIC